MSEIWVSVAGHGDNSGTDRSNAIAFAGGTGLQSAIALAIAGDTIMLRNDSVDYELDATVQWGVSGTPGNLISLQGEGSDAQRLPEAADISNHSMTWPRIDCKGKIFIQLAQGSEYWMFRKLRVIDAVRHIFYGPDGGHDGCKIFDIDSENCEEICRIQDGVADNLQLEIDNVRAIGLRKRIHLDGIVGGNIRNLNLDCRRADGTTIPDWAIMLRFDTNSKNVTVEDCVFAYGSTIDMIGGEGLTFDNGDGGGSEKDTDGIIWRRIRCLSMGDSAFDLKGTRHKIYEGISDNTPRGFRWWDGQDYLMEDCKVLGPGIWGTPVRSRGHSDHAGIWLGGGSLTVRNAFMLNPGVIIIADGATAVATFEGGDFRLGVGLPDRSLNTQKDNAAATIIMDGKQKYSGMIRVTSAPVGYVPPAPDTRPPVVSITAVGENIEIGAPTTDPGDGGTTEPTDPGDSGTPTAYQQADEDAWTITSDDGAGNYTAEISFVNPTGQDLDGWLYAFESSFVITSVSSTNARDVQEDPVIPGYHQIRPTSSGRALGATDTLTITLEFTTDAAVVTPTKRIFNGVKMYDPDPIPTEPVVINYGEALQKSFLFWELQRSGPITDWPDNRLDYIGDTFVTRDVSSEGRKLHGYFDAGDGVLFDMPQAVGMLNLAWSAVEFEQGYSAMGQLGYMRSALRWGLRYILNGHITEDNNGSPRTAKVYGQVGDGTLDHSYQGPPEDYPETIAREQQFLDRTNGGGSDLAADKASALAAGSIVFEVADPSFSAECLNVAKMLYEFAKEFRKPYDDTINSAPFHRSGAAIPPNNPIGDEDELCLAAIWLHKATGEQTYLDEAVAIYPGKGPFYNKNEVHMACHVLLDDLIPATADYRNNAETWFKRICNEPDASPKTLVTFSAEGLAILGDWGSLAFACNMGFVLEVFTKNLKARGETYRDSYDTFPKRQLDIVLGDNNNKFSFVCGISPIPGTTRWPKAPHHRRARQRGEFNTFLPNTYTAWGGMVGGPRNSTLEYTDIAKEYEEGELALNYQAGYTALTAAMAARHGGTPLTDAQLNELEGVTVL